MDNSGVTLTPPLLGGLNPLFLHYEKCNNASNGYDPNDIPYCRNLLVKGNLSDVSNSYDMEDPYEVSKRLALVIAIVVPILFGIIVLIGLIGNALVVIVVAVNAQMRSTTNLLIINLAVADLLFIVFCVPFTAADYVVPSWPFGNVWCKCVQYLIVVTAYASVYTLVLMSLDRFLAVVHPIQSRSYRTEKHAIIAICIVWFVILTASIPVYYSHGEKHYDYNNEHHAACIFLSEEYNWPAFEISFFITSYVLPLALICGLYLLMLLRLWHGVAPGVRVSAESRRGKKRVTRMVVIVVATFAICWCPIQIILVLKSLNNYELTTLSIIIQIVSHTLAYMNSCVNPILYAFLSENFRKAFRKVFGYCFPGAINGPMRGAEGGNARLQNGRLIELDKSEIRAATKTTRTNGSNDIL